MAHGEAIIGVEKLSKNELKRREKMKKKEAEKAAKEAAKAAKLAANPKPAEEKKEDEEDVDPTKYFENRLAVVKKAEETGNTYYPHKFEVQVEVVVVRDERLRRGASRLHVHHGRLHLQETEVVQVAADLPRRQVEGATWT